MKRKGYKWARWQRIAAHLKPKAKGAEIGCYAGEMSEAMFALVPKLRLCMIDRFEPYSRAERAEFPRSAIVQTMERRAWKNVKRRAVAVAQRHRRASILRSDAVEAAKRFKDGSLDFIFIDSDHSYEGFKRILAAWFPKLKPAGMVMSYDYGDDRDAEVLRAVAELERPIEMEKGRLWLVRK